MKRIIVLVILSFLGHSAFSQRQKQQAELPMRARYKPIGYSNAITANVPTLMMLDLLPGTTAGLEYERFLNKKGRVSLSIPAYAFIAKTANKGSNQSMITGYYAAPALLYHPRGNTGFIDYSFGPSIAVGRLERHKYKMVDSLVSYDKFNFFAAMLEGNMKVHTTGHFVFVLHAAFGSMLGNTVVHPLLGQFGMKMGMRF